MAADDVPRPGAPEQRLPLRQRLLVRAAFLAGGLSTFLLGLPALHVDVADLVARGGASDDVLRRRTYLVRRMREGGVRPKDIATAHDLFKGERYPGR